jgi:hypothetical protein
MKKAIIGLGCSWTQGEGGYPDDVWKKYNGRVNLPMHKSMHLIPYEMENSWVNVLSKKYLPEYTPVNLGQRGLGNRGSVKSLYLADIDWNSLEDGIVVFLLSGFERFDFFREDWRDTNICGKHDHKKCGHYNFQTLWPHLGNNIQMDVYARHIYSEAGTAAEQLVNILEAQTFCKAHGLKFVLANAFDGRGSEFIQENCGDEFTNKIDWDNYLHSHVDYKSFVELLVKRDKFLPEDRWQDYYGHYQDSKWPKTYLTNCVHPTIAGYELMAEELGKFIKKRYSV